MRAKKISREEKSKHLLTWLIDFRANNQTLTNGEMRKQLTAITRDNSISVHFINVLRENNILTGVADSVYKRKSYLSYNQEMIHPNMKMVEKAYSVAIDRRYPKDEDQKLRNRFPANIEGSCEFNDANTRQIKQVTVKDFAEEVQALKELYEDQLGITMTVTINIAQTINV